VEGENESIEEVSPVLMMSFALLVYLKLHDISRKSSKSTIFLLLLMQRK
jgi:hypothetical protein